MPTPSSATMRQRALVCVVRGVLPARRAGRTPAVAECRFMVVGQDIGQEASYLPPLARGAKYAFFLFFILLLEYRK